VSRLALVIPVVGSTEGLENTLLSVLERRPDDCEVIVATSTTYDDPYKLQGEIQILQAPRGAGLVDCANHAIRSTAAPIVHILAVGAQATDGWIDCAARHFENPRVAAVVPFVHSEDNSKSLLAVGVSYPGHGRRQICRNVNACEQIIGPQLGAAFYRKSVIDAIGGIPSCVGDMLAEVDLAMVLRKAGWQIELEPACKVLAQQIDGRLPAGFRSALWSQRLYRRHFTGDGVPGLVPHSLAQSTDTAGSKPWWKMPSSAAGRLAGMLEFGQYRAANQVVAAAAAALGHAQSQDSGEREIRSEAPPQRERAIQRIDAAHSSSVPPQKRKHSYQTPGTRR
jgi:GT2 family glycosyltransferase